MIQQWHNYITKKDNKIYLYHWGNAEKVYINYMKQTCPHLDFSNIELINILHYIREEPILIQGIFSFGLKQMGKVLYDHQLIQTTWTEHDNGLDTMIEFKELCLQHTKQIPLRKSHKSQLIKNKIYAFKGFWI